jgi:hypothetical protein
METNWSVNKIAARYLWRIMGTSALTILNNQTVIQEGGLGLTENKLFAVKPATLTIVQPNSQVEGAIKGNLRIAETGDQFSEMWATLLVMPTEQRQYHIGQPGELNRTPENLMCFSTDMIQPHPKARVPQALLCANCPKADWEPWREYKEKNNGMSNKTLIPPCDAHYIALLMDDKYKLPLRMYIRSKAKDSFEFGMNNVARIIAMMKAEGKKPNIFDVKFRIRTKMITTGKFQSYIPTFTDPIPITDDEREQFGAVYLQYINQKAKQEQANAQAEAEAEVSASQGGVDSSVVEGEYVGDDTITI